MSVPQDQPPRLEFLKKIPYRKLAKNYFFELPVVLIASVTACVICAFLYEGFTSLLRAAFADPGARIAEKNLGTFIHTAYQFIIMGHMFIGASLLLLYVPISLKLKSGRRRGFWLPLTCMMTSLANAIAVTVAAPIIGIILIPCAVVTGCMTGAFHDGILSAIKYFKEKSQPAVSGSP